MHHHVVDRSRATPTTRRRGHEAQSLVEFAIILPIMLALVGMTLDFARVYRVWVDLESVSRSAAEHLATNVDKTVTVGNASSIARGILELESNVGFAVASDLDSCTAPTVMATYSTSTGAVGASPSYPIGTATVSTCRPFRSLFAYPLLTTDGLWVVRSEQTFQIVQGR